MNFCFFKREIIEKHVVSILKLSIFFLILYPYVLNSFKIQGGGHQSVKNGCSASTNSSIPCTKI